ncbi:MAG TPA: hypothetical protein DCZ95_12440 [Verrucomicrobia bacterium]|nr:hypothetical protein [Verrucomicrobiota bacterium]
MSMIKKEIGELRDMLGDFKEGNITNEQALIQVSIYSQIEKRMRMMLMAHSLSARFGPSMKAQLKLSGIAEGEDIDPHTPHAEKGKAKVR